VRAVLEILALLVIFGAYLEAARRQLGVGWRFLAINLALCLVLGGLAPLLLGEGPHLALLMVFGAYLETARRRGGTGWPFVVAGLLGYLVLSSVTALLLGRGLHLLVGGAWLALVYVSVSVTRWIRRASTPHPIG